MDDKPPNVLTCLSLRIGLGVGLLLATLGQVWLVFSAIPLGVPGEWVWERLLSESWPWSLGVFALFGAGYVAFVRAGAIRLESATTWGRGLWLAGLVLAAFAWLWVVQEQAPAGFQLSKAGWVLYFRGPSGYFTDAQASSHRRAEFLAGYEDEVAKGDVLHFGTHPPGLVIGFWALSDLASVGSVRDFALASQPASVRETFDEIGRHGPLSPADRAVLWLALLAVMFAAALTVLPLYGLLRLEYSPATCWLAASLWPTVPAIAVFVPKSDVLLAFWATVGLWLWISSVLVQRLRWLRASVAGLWLFAGLTISLALLPAVFLAGVWTVCHIAQSGASRTVVSRRICLLALWTILAFVVACGLVWWLAALNLPAVWWRNYQNHAGFYAKFHRTYWKWLLVNPSELVIACGLPLTLLALIEVVQQAAGCRRRPPAASEQRKAMLIACLVTWAVLWLTGKNSGEAARLWCFSLPWMIWIGAGALPLRSAAGGDGSVDRATLQHGLLVLAAQLVASAVTVSGVVGFQVVRY